MSKRARDRQLSPSQTIIRPEHGQYQANGVMGAAKKTGQNPR